MRLPPIVRRLAALLVLPLLAAGTGASLAAEAPLRLMAFGDSLIHGYGLPDGETFPDQLQAALTAQGRAVTVINAGSSGDTSAAGLARLDWNLAEKPDAVILLLGANDALRGLDPAETRRNLEAMLAILERHKLPVLLAGMKAPPNLGAGYAGEFDAIYPALAKRHDLVFYPFFLEGVAAVPALNQDDGMHPNAQGVATIVKGILPKVDELLDRARAAREAANG
ncbi:acyl-CoA thioesterase-1 [Tistlia consotensis]|uniref:Acyl-CoA thioesterase-1 n=1 Tax=Tistlia consotensis USBA 355 TaxID=560819 RepID=A0A1Y6CMN6_9PROT|nr:arylesterase [Tistlia consotensis]SMF78132.1 acyl-CoA thioesterase-1 [Tistlia consotensis USBA 355]SNS17875.1 acyl-CoA thioesterase-1 [Tistlia consotensis]